MVAINAGEDFRSAHWVLRQFENTTNHSWWIIS